MTFHYVCFFIKSVWNTDKNHYYNNIFLEKTSDELPNKKFFYIKYKCYITTELTFLKKMFIRQANQKSGIFVSISTFYLNSLSFNHMHTNTKGGDYCFVISGISKNEAINLIQNIGLTEISGT